MDIQIQSYKAIKFAQVTIDSNFTVITGATSSGKSTMLEGIYLALEPNNQTPNASYTIQCSHKVSNVHFFGECLNDDINSFLRRTIIDIRHKKERGLDYSEDKAVLAFWNSLIQKFTNITKVTLLDSMALQFTQGADGIEYPAVVFSQLSSGVRYILELLFAIVSQMGEAGAYCIVSKPDVLEGVFLIDDYGNCLDKWWKSRLTRELKDTFKNVKFVVAYSGLGKAGDVICMM